MAYVNPRMALGDALYGVLAMDSTLGTIAPGGVWFNVPQLTAAFPFPFVLLEISQDDDEGGYSSFPGRNSRPTLVLRVLVFQSDYGTDRDADLVMQRITTLLWEGDPLVIEGYRVMNGSQRQPLRSEPEIPFPHEELRGLKVKELNRRFEYSLEEVAA